jgi:hypothetical protein
MVFSFLVVFFKSPSGWGASLEDNLCESVPFVCLDEPVHDYSWTVHEPFMNKSDNSLKVTVKVTIPDSPPICLHGLSYLSLTSLTLVEHPLFLLLPQSYFLNTRPKRYMMCVHLQIFITSLCIIRHSDNFSPLFPVSCLLWIKKVRSKDKTYIWVSV